MLQFPSKTTAEELTYWLGWSGVLNGATIQTAVWSLSPSDGQIVKITEGVDNTKRRTLIKIGGGVLNVTYTVSVFMVDSAGEKHQRHVTLKIISPKPQ